MLGDALAGVVRPRSGRAARTEEGTMAMLLYVAAHGPDDPTKACMPIHLAVNGAAAAGIDVENNLPGHAGVLNQDRYIETVMPLGFPPLRDLMARARERGVRIHVCGGCAQARGVSHADLEVKNAVVTFPPDLARRCAVATNVLVF